MEALKENKLLAGLLIASIVVGGGYLLLRDDGTVAEGPLLESSYRTSYETREILDSLRMLEQFTFNPAFFETKEFLSLQDFTVPVNVVPLGRRDPFALLPGMIEE